MSTRSSDQNRLPWKCASCSKRMGDLFKRKVHLRPRHGHTYFSRYPVTGVCNRCGHTNTIERFPTR